LQSSWTKRAVEVDSPKPMLPWDQLADPPDSTFAQVIHSRSEACDNWVPLATTKKFGKQDDELGLYGFLNFHSLIPPISLLFLTFG